MNPNKPSFQLGSELYDIEQAEVLKANGERIPLPTVSGLIEYLPKSSEEEKPIIAFKMPSVTVQMKFKGPELSKLLALFQRPWDGDVFHLEPNGKVIFFGEVKLTMNAENERSQRGWFFSPEIDRATWKYALQNHLQLEDAVRQINWIHRQGSL